MKHTANISTTDFYKLNRNVLPIVFFFTQEVPLLFQVNTISKSNQNNSTTQKAHLWVHTPNNAILTNQLILKNKQDSPLTSALCQSALTISGLSRHDQLDSHFLGSEGIVCLPDIYCLLLGLDL